MLRRFDHAEFEGHNAAIRTMLVDLLASGQTTLYSRVYTYDRLRQAGMPVVHDRMFKILKTIDPTGVAGRRLHLNTKPKRAYSGPGPNFVWSIDGHHKLSMYGIEIYAAIEAFSRYVSLS